MSGRVVNPRRWRRRGWSRFVPTSLMGQMVLVLALALVLTQVVSLVIFADERRFALQSLNQDETVSRTASTLRVLDETPPELHERILEAATSSRLRFWIDDDSAVAEDHRRMASNWLAKRLRSQVDLPAGRDVRVDIREAAFGWFRDEVERDDDFHDDDDDDDGHGRWGHHGPVSLLIAVELEDGRWLNAENMFRGPPRGRKWAAVVTITILVVGISLISIMLVLRITRPMKRLAGAAERMGRGEETGVLEETGPSEARETTRAFNRMAERLRRFIDDRTHMLAATGHDLRTPLTSLRLRAELVEDKELKAKMLSTVDEMARMVEAMLAFAREDAVSEETRAVDLRSLVTAIADDLAAMDLDVTVADGPRIVHRCRQVSLTRALRNLIENAARHGGNARVDLREEDETVVIRVDDDGPGIPDDRIEDMFEPFARLDAARNTEAGSMGLGLAIARSVIRAHGGDIALANRPGGGFRATVTLPKV